MLLWLECFGTRNVLLFVVWTLRMLLVYGFSVHGLLLLVHGFYVHSLVEILLAFDALRLPMGFGCA